MLLETDLPIGRVTVRVNRSDVTENAMSASVTGPVLTYGLGITWNPVVVFRANPTTVAANVSVGFVQLGMGAIKKYYFRRGAPPTEITSWRTVAMTTGDAYRIDTGTLIGLWFDPPRTPFDTATANGTTPKVLEFEDYPSVDVPMAFMDENGTDQWQLQMIKGGNIFAVFVVLEYGGQFYVTSGLRWGVWFDGTITWPLAGPPDFAHAGRIVTADEPVSADATWGPRFGQAQGQPHMNDERSRTMTDLPGILRDYPAPILTFFGYTPV